MTFHRIGGVGNSVPLDVGRAGAGDFSNHPEAAHDQAAVRNLSGADDAIDAFPDEIHQAIALTDLKVKQRITIEEFGEPRQEERACQQGMRIDAQQTAGLHVAEGVFRFVDLREDRNAALVEGRAVQRRCDMPGRSLEKPNANIVFQLLDRFRGGGSGKPEVGRRRSKAAPLNDPDEELHAVEPVHGFVHHSRILMSILAQLF